MCFPDWTDVMEDSRQFCRIIRCIETELILRDCFNSSNPCTCMLVIVSSRITEMLTPELAVFHQLDLARLRVPKQGLALR